jgi:hypothetical protein
MTKRDELEEAREAFDRDLPDLIGVKVHDYAVAYKSGFDAALQQSQWVAVDGGLPEEDGGCLITNEGREVCFAWFELEYKTFRSPEDDSWWYEEVIAWMPLPTPYQEVK